ncbi:MAG: 3'-5' exonuclease [Candidatus Omnitrophota bacterium]|nr:MAG: 3'-5' exonuclease [Candidatus Omnitrophota bacterium]
MSEIIFDIETVGMDFEALDKISKETLLKNAKDDQQVEDVKNSLGLYPVTAQIVTIAMVEANTDSGIVYFQDSIANCGNFKESNIEYVRCSEKEILENFWQKIVKYDKFVTFNGRGFDCPFIMLRSGINKVKTIKNLVPYRYNADLHIDLFDQLSFYGAMRRGFSLHMWTQALGIESPKQEGICGADVTKFYKAGKAKDIARYCMRDVWATKQLYLIWKKYIKCKSGRYA